MGAGSAQGGALRAQRRGSARGRSRQSDEGAAAALARGSRSVRFGGTRGCASRESCVYEALQFLRQECGFDMLVDITCVDYLHYRDAVDRFGLVYLLCNTDENVRLTVRVMLNEPDLTVPSVTSLWEGANWLEREVFDMFGIHFRRASGPAAHPDAAGVHGASAAQGLSAPGTRRTAQFHPADARGRVSRGRFPGVSASEPGRVLRSAVRA